MPATAVYDANVLYPNTLRDLLIRLGRAGPVHARWTEQILAEMSTALRRQRPDVDEQKVGRLVQLMNSAVRDCLITGYEDLIESIVLPDKDDLHVLAAAITGSAEVIVTWNLRDFPAQVLSQYGIRAVSPDDFVLGLIRPARPVVWSSIQQIVDARLRRPQTAQDILAQLERDGLIRSTAELAGQLAGSHFGPRSRRHSRDW
jgi:predicted nucleic acid-binding protein